MNLDHSKSYIFSIRNFFDRDECQMWIEKIDKEKPQIASITTKQGYKVKEKVRNN